MNLFRRCGLLSLLLLLGGAACFQLAAEDSMTLQELREALEEADLDTDVVDQIEERLETCNNASKPCVPECLGIDCGCGFTYDEVQWVGEDEDCPDGTILISGSLVDVALLSHLHLATDFSIDGSGGCAPCGGGSGLGKSQSLPSLSISRVHRYRDLHRVGSFGPAVFLGVYDSVLTLYRKENGNKTTSRFFQTTMPLEIAPKGSSGSAVLIDNRYSYIRDIVIASGFDAAGDPIHEVDVALATHAVLTFHDGTRWIFEVIRIGGPSTQTFSARLTQILNLNDQGITIAYQHPRDATDAELDFDRKNLWKMATITDAHARQVTASYHPTVTFGGRPVIQTLTVPVNDGFEDITYTYELEGLLDGNGDPIPEVEEWNITGLSGVDYPDGSTSTFSISHDVDGQLQWLFIHDAGAEGTHRRKHIGLSLDTWFDAATNTVFPQGGRMLQVIANGERELTHAFLESPIGQHDGIVVQAMGKTFNYSHSGGYPNNVKYVKDFDFGLPRSEWESAWDFEDTATYRHDTMRRITRDTDDLGRQTHFQLDPVSGKRTKVTYPDNTFERAEYNAFNQITLFVDREGRVTTATYDPVNGNPLTKTIGQVLDAGGVPQPTDDTVQVFDKQYNAAGQVTEERDALYNPASPDLHVTNYVYDPVTKLLHQRIDSADFTGGQRPVTTFDWYASGQLKSVTDPVGRTTTFLYDARNRLIQTTYSDDSTDLITYGISGEDVNLILSRTDRSGSVTTFEYDAHGRRTRTVTAANDPAISVEDICTYIPGTTLRATCIDKGELREYSYDYKNRLIATTVHPNQSTALSDARFYDDAGRLRFSQDHYGRRQYPVYDKLDYVIRQVRETVPDGVTSALGLPSGALPSEAALDALPRDLGANAAYTITDQVYNSDRDLIKEVDGRGIISKHEYDGQGRRDATVASYATVPPTATSGIIQAGTAETLIGDPKVARRMERIFDGENNVIESRHPRYFDSSDAEGFGAARETMTYTGRNLLASRTDATGSGIEASESFTYYLDGRRASHTDFRGNIWTTTWGACCARLQGQLQPTTILAGASQPTTPGQVNRHNDYGDLTHSAVVSAYDASVYPTLPDPINSTDIPDAHTVNETTTRFDARHRPIAQTEWLSPCGAVDANNPPIANRVVVPVANSTHPAAEGLTTTWQYDDDLTDGVGLDAAYADYVAILNLGAGADGSGVAVTNPEGETSVTFYDGLMRQVLTIEADGDARQMVYDILEAGTPGAPGVLVATSQIVDPDRSGHTGLKLISSSRTDALGRTLASIDQLNFVTTMSYDAISNRISHRDPNGVGQDCTFDSANREIICTDTENDTTFTVYDAAGQVIQTLDGVGVVARGGPSSYAPPFAAGTLGLDRCVFDARGRKIECYDRLDGNNPGSGQQQSLILYAYDENNNLKAITDNEGGITRYFYDPRNLLEREEFPTHAAGTDPGDAGNDARAYQYDGASRLVERVDQLGDLTSYDYDLVNRLLTRSYPDNLNDIFTYDAASRLLTAESQRYANLVTRSYFDDSTIQSEILDIDDLHLVISHTYDAANRRVTSAYPNGDQRVTTWTQRSQLDGITFAGQIIANFVYDPGSRETSRTFGNNIVEARTYYADNLTASITAGGGSITDFDYTYDANKRKLTAMDGAPGMSGFSQSFSYDAEDRLTSWSRSGGDGFGTTEAQDWTLTLVGDWKDTTRDSISEVRTHNAVHEIESIDGATLMHDAKGNLTYNPQRQHTYTWDFDNRMSKTRITVSIFPMVFHEVTYRYDALGRRVQLTDVAEGLVTTYALSGAQVYTEYENGMSARSYVDGSYIDDHLAVIEHPSDDIYYYHNDHRCSVAALTDDTGAVVKRYGYDAYGKREIVVDMVPSVADTYGHTGLWHEFASELTYVRQRYYCSLLGRFIARDTLGYLDGLGSYAAYFVPNHLDPTGNIVYQTEIIAKSYIAFVGNNLGQLPILANHLLFSALATATDLSFNENPATSDVNDRQYRLYSRYTVQFECCNGDQLVGPIPPTPIRGSRVGREPEPGGLQPPDGIFAASSGVERVDPSTLRVKYSFKGRPHALAEPSFQIVWPRANRFIWHEVSVLLFCQNGEGKHQLESFAGSKFPSHRLWINSELKQTIQQGAFSGLWSLENPP